MKQKSPRAGKRDNLYYLDRLKKRGRSDLVAAVEQGHMSAYRACREGGLRSGQRLSNAERIERAWDRATLRDRALFFMRRQAEVLAAHDLAPALYSQILARNQAEASAIKLGETGSDTVSADQCTEAVPSNDAKLHQCTRVRSAE